MLYRTIPDERSYTVLPTVGIKWRECKERLLDKTVCLHLMGYLIVFGIEVLASLELKAGS